MMADFVWLRKAILDLLCDHEIGDVLSSSVGRALTPVRPEDQKMVSFLIYLPSSELIRPDLFLI